VPVRARMLLTRAFLELIRFDVVSALFGFQAIHGRLKRQRAARRRSGQPEGAICRAVETATCFYWRRVLCLQRAVVTVRMLRAHGIPAELVIGCRPAPFLSHAWVEVDGRVLNGSSAFRQKLLVLERV